MDIVKIKGYDDPKFIDSPGLNIGVPIYYLGKLVGYSKKSGKNPEDEKLISNFSRISGKKYYPAINGETQFDLEVSGKKLCVSTGEDHLNNGFKKCDIMLVSGYCYDLKRLNDKINGFKGNRLEQKLFISDGYDGSVHGFNITLDSFNKTYDISEIRPIESRYYCEIYQA